METGPCLFTTEGGHSWHSVQDVMNSLGSLTLFPGGGLGETQCTEKTNNGKAVPERKRPRTPRSIGRGKILKMMERSSSVMARDAALQRDLRAACGRGFSNELIEHYWGNNSGETFTDERPDCIPGQFDFNLQTFSELCSSESKSLSDNKTFDDDSGSDINIGFQSKKANALIQDPTEESSHSPVSNTLDLFPESLNAGETNPMGGGDSVNSVGGEKSGKNKISKKNPPRCRNALILGLQRRELDEMHHRLQDRSAKVDEFPLSLQLPNHSSNLYSNALSHSKPLNYKESVGKKDNLNFTLIDNDFPPLS